MPDLKELTPDGGSGEGRGWLDERPERASGTNVAFPSSSRPSASSLQMRGLEVSTASERLWEIESGRGRDRTPPVFRDLHYQPRVSGTGGGFVTSPPRAEKNANASPSPSPWLAKRGRRRRSADGGSRDTPGGGSGEGWATRLWSPNAKTHAVNTGHGTGFDGSRIDAQMEQWLRQTVERMPVRPDAVSNVRGPAMHVAPVDDKTVDVTMTTKFRAHFKQPLAALAQTSGGGGGRTASQNVLELPAPGDGAALVVGGIGGLGGMHPGSDGGRFGIAGPDDYVVGGGMLDTVRQEEYGNGRHETLLLSDAETAAKHATNEWLVNQNDIRLHERVAVGGFAEVFRGTWNGTVVAVKQLLERGPDVVARLRAEVVTLSKLRHPNLLLFMGWCASPPLIATEFMRRGSLHTILKRNGGNLGAIRTHHVSVSVAKGMQYLHSRQPPILHLDLKSPNILVDDKWRAKIADFGLARVRRNTLVSGKSGFHGTPEWMAPEMLRAEDYDEKADTYSYGVVLWELLTAKTPWHELHPMQCVAVVGYSDRRLVLPPDSEKFVNENFVTRTMGDLFEACASKSPKLRPDFDEILRTLERAPTKMLPGPSEVASDSDFEKKTSNQESNPGPFPEKTTPVSTPGPENMPRARTAGLEIEEIEFDGDHDSRTAAVVAAAANRAKQVAGQVWVPDEDDEMV